jgi:hypothetical protein
MADGEEEDLEMNRTHSLTIQEFGLVEIGF